MTSRPRWWLLAAHLALKSKPHSKSLPHPLLARAPAAFARHPQQASGQSESSLSRDGWRSALGPTSAAGLGPIRKQTLERWMEECACVRAAPPPPPLRSCFFFSFRPLLFPVGERWAQARPKFVGGRRRGRHDAQRAAPAKKGIAEGRGRARGKRKRKRRTGLQCGRRRPLLTP